MARIKSIRAVSRMRKHPGALLLAWTRQFDRTAAAHLPALLVHPLGDRQVGGRGSVVIGMVCDLLVVGAAGKRSIENFPKLVDLVPADDALFDRIEESCLAFLLDRTRASW